LKTEPQTEGKYYSLPQLEKCKDIDEYENTEEIDRKIRAFWNPPYSGAQIELKGKKYTVINEDVLNWIANNIRDYSIIGS
jgi:methionyl-tRNA formyltransferase